MQYFITHNVVHILDNICCTRAWNVLHMRSLRKLLGISWMNRTSNTVCLSKCGLTNYDNDDSSTQTALTGTCQKNKKWNNPQRYSVRRANCWKAQSWASPITLLRCVQQGHEGTEYRPE